MSVESCEASGALRMLTEFDAVHAALVRFTTGLMGKNLFGSDVELIDAVVTKPEGEVIWIDSFHRFGMLIDGGPDLNELSISCGLMVGVSNFSSRMSVEASFDTAAGILSAGKTVLLSDQVSSESFHEALNSFNEHAKLVIGSPEVFSRLNL